MIPRIIHQTWRDHDVPGYLRPFQSSWQKFHPNWEYWLWTDLDNRKLIADHYSWFLDQYDAYPWTIQRVDAARYFMLHRYGGLYVGLDFECLKPLTPVLAEESCVLGTEPHAHAAHHGRTVVVANALMASEASHPVWTHVYTVLARSSGARNNRGEVDVLNSTGPLMLTDALASYQDQDVRIMAPEVFYPMLDVTNPEVFTNVEIPVNQQQQAYADRILRRDYPPEAFAIHHWAGTWFDNAGTKQSLIEAMQSHQSKAAERP
jgi:mannosyltransferase OCH1-like enzyme